jgi:small glutamine-rich tetratricopeptide repeat-containing protein alpha
LFGLFDEGNTTGAESGRVFLGMAQSNAHLAKRIDLAALAHLSERCNALPDCKAALETIARALGVDPRSKSDAYRYGTDATLSELYVAGLEKLGSASLKRPTDADIFASAKFAKYLETVRKKGVFDKVSEGTSEYEAIMDKVKSAFAKKFEPSKPSISKEDAEKQAEELKLQGNDKLAASDYIGAIGLYDQCLELSPDGPNTHIYYSNRAAAYTQLKEFEHAVEDCVAALALKPDFAKAHSRLANAFLNLNRLEEAQQSAERTLELDPSNGVAAAVLEKIKSQKDSGKGKPTPRGGPPVMPGGMPRGPPAGFPGMGGGGMPDLGSMMNDPMMQQMMQNPQMMQMAQQMMSDPNAMANLMGMMGGGAGRGRQ